MLHQGVLHTQYKHRQKLCFVYNTSYIGPIGLNFFRSFVFTQTSYMLLSCRQVVRWVVISAALSTHKLASRGLLPNVQHPSEGGTQGNKFFDRTYGRQKPCFWPFLSVCVQAKKACAENQSWTVQACELRSFASCWPSAIGGHVGVEFFCRHPVPEKTGFFCPATRYKYRQNYFSSQHE